MEHLAHAGTAGRALVADDDRVALRDRASLDGGEALLLGVEDTRRAAVKHAPVSSQLDHAALRREVSPRDRDAAVLLDRLCDIHDNLLARGLLCRGRDVGHRSSIDVLRLAVQEVLLQKLARDERDATGFVHVGGYVVAARLEARYDRRAMRDPVEVVDRQLDADLVRDCEQVENAVGRARGRGDGCDRVLECLAGDDLRRADVVADELHNELPGLLGRFALLGNECGNAVQPGRADTEEVERRRHRVRCETGPPHAPAPGQATLSSSCSFSALNEPALCAPTASNTSWIVTSRPSNLPGAIEPL